MQVLNRRWQRKSEVGLLIGWLTVDIKMTPHLVVEQILLITQKAKKEGNLTPEAYLKIMDNLKELVWPDLPVGKRKVVTDNERGQNAEITYGRATRRSQHSWAFPEG